MAKIAEQSGLVGIVNHRKGGGTIGAEFLRNQVDSSIEQEYATQAEKKSKFWFEI